MIYKPRKDLSGYCDAYGNFTPEGAARLRQESDAYFEEMAEFKRSAHAGVCIYKGKINEKLQEGKPAAYNAIVAMLNEENYLSTAHYDDELMHFYSTAQIYRLEEGSVEKTIYDIIRYVDDFDIIYTKVLFMYRRIVQGLDHSDIAAELKDMQLSVFTMGQLLLDVPLTGKKKITAVLSDHFRREGKNKEAQYLCRLSE